MVDYDPTTQSPAQVLPFQDLPSTDTPVTASWLNHLNALLADLATATTGRIPVLETSAGAEAIRDTIAAFAVAGTNMTITHDDGANTLTFDAATAAYTDEDARDALGAALVASTGITITVSDPGDTITIAASPNYNFVASDHGFCAWAYDPCHANTSTALSAAGVMHMIRVKLPVAATIASIVVDQTNSSAAGMSNCYAGLYDSSGTLVASTADQSTAWETSQVHEMALSSPYAAVAGTYYVGLLVGGFSTAPTFRRNGASDTVNAGIAAASGYRFSTSGSSLTALPSSVTLSANTGDTSASATAYWCALKV